MTNKSNLTRYLQRDCLCRVGARRIEIRHARILSKLRPTPRQARNLCAQSRECRLSVRASLSPTCEASQSDWTGDRREFIGRNGTLANPAALASASPLSNKVGAALDPCAAMRSKLELLPGSVAEVVFFLGDAATREDARAMIHAFRTADLDALEADIARSWDETLSAIEVKTPDRAMDLMLNGWLLYQTLACRIWARSAFYQASGAYGFRDQLQDGMALAAPGADTDPRTPAARSRPPVRRGRRPALVAARIPVKASGPEYQRRSCLAGLLQVAQYVATTARHGRARRIDPFSRGSATPEAGETDRFFEPQRFHEKSATLSNIAPWRSMQVWRSARHGLPLIGTGDWNDGMNRVGEKGEGESVWLGWFLHAALTAFAPLAAARNETTRAETWTAHADALKAAIERDGLGRRMVSQGLL